MTILALIALVFEILYYYLYQIFINFIELVAILYTYISTYL